MASERFTSVSRSLSYLSSLAITPRQAIEQLDQASTSVQLLALFKHYFPKEFSRFKSFTQGEAHHAMQTFVGLINQKMFPIDEMILEEEWSELGSPQWVPIQPANEDWWNREIGDLCAFDRAILTACGAIGAPTNEDEDYADFSCRTPDYRKLQRSCKGPLKDLPLAAKYLFHDTGNPWCDMSWEEDTTNVRWDVEWLDYLTAEWKKAREILQRVRKVDKWVNDNPSQLERVRKLVAAAIPVEKVRDNRPLVETLIDDGDPTG